MAAKTEIVEVLGERALVLPTLLAAGLAANERAKYILTLLQMAESHADNPAAPVSSLRKEREACGIADASLDRVVTRAVDDGDGAYHIPGAKRLVGMLDDALRAMVKPVSVASDGNGDASSTPFQERLDSLIAARPSIEDDMLSRETIATLTGGGTNAGDSLHALVMELHKEINRLQAAIATMDVDGAKAYGLTDADRAALAAFMAGLNRTAPLKFDHPGLDTVAVRANGALLIQNDIGTTEAHVLVLKVSGLTVTVTHTDIHLPRVRFLQRLCADTGIQWEDIRSRENPRIEDGDLYYLALGQFTAADEDALHAFLDRLGSRIVFLIDWNKARKRLRLLVPKKESIAVLRWAADHDIGHRGFLQLGGERLIYDALEQAVKTPLRYGEPLYEMIGTEVAEDFLRFVLEIASRGLQENRSQALIRDRIRAELFTHFHSAEQRFLTSCSDHAVIVSQLADGLRAALRQGAARRDGLVQHRTRAKQWESRADDVVKALRATVRRFSGTQIFCQIVETADDAADHLEDAAFYAALLYETAAPPDLPDSLLALADLLSDGAQAYRRAMELAQYVHRGGERDAVQQFLEVAEGVVTIEHQTDEREREVMTTLMTASLDARQLQLLTEISGHLEEAADALMRASLKLRDHILGEAMFA